MNYLAHAYLSFGNAEILAGNLAGDYFKGKKILEEVPPGISKGIRLHRLIDDFTDHHFATNRAKIWFSEKYGLYAGALTDIVFDHFLANDPRLFRNEKALFDFTQNTYQLLQTQTEQLPEKFLSILPHMIEHNWLYHYRTMKGIEQSFRGLQRKASYLEDTHAAYEIFVVHYYELNQAYFELIDDLLDRVKIELSERA